MNYLENLNRIVILIISLVTGMIVFFGFSNQDIIMNKLTEDNQDEIKKPESEWKKELTEDEYNVLREKGTERAFFGKYNNFKKDGVFLCAACGNEVFDSEHKYDSGSGWPSFYRPADPESVETKPDKTMGMVRTEVVCDRCHSHLGHVFDDGPDPTGLRYCINSVALDFKEEK